MGRAVLAGRSSFSYGFSPDGHDISYVAILAITRELLSWGSFNSVENSVLRIYMLAT